MATKARVKASDASKISQLRPRFVLCGLYDVVPVLDCAGLRCATWLVYKWVTKHSV